MVESDNSSSITYPSPSPSPSPRPPPSPPHPPDPPTAELVALRLFSSNVESLLLSPSLSDARISFTSHPHLPVHRCLLSARSPFFRDRFANTDPGVDFPAADLVPHVGVEAFKFVLGYIYSGKVAPLPKGEACCADEDCPHIKCRPAIEFMLEILRASFVFQIFELVSLFQRRLLDILHKVDEDDALSILSVAILCGMCCDKLLTSCIEFVAQSSLDVITIEKALSHDAKTLELIKDSRNPEAICDPSIHVKRILRALDSDDVELLNLLLKENHTTLDDAYALHYAVAHCDSKITTQLLDLGIANVNLKNHRGYTVLHVAAMRKEPTIIVPLLTKGADPSDVAPDGRKALQIAKQVTKYSEFARPLMAGTTASTDRLCIEILENAEANNILDVEAASILANAGETLETQLHYLDTRVSLARLLFPVEARIAMENAKAKGTSELELTNCDTLPRHQERSIDDLIMLRLQSQQKDDLNRTPFFNYSERLSKAIALSKTVETAKRFFPRCTKAIDKYMDHDTIDIENEDKQQKRKRFEELQQEFSEAFYQDKEALSASSSTPSFNGQRGKSTRRKV